MKFWLLILPFLVHGLIIETEHMEEVLSHVDSNTVVFFDVDDTLFTSDVQLGKALRFLDEWNMLKAGGLSDEEALPICRAHWDAIQKRCLIRHLDPEIKSILQWVQAQALYTMALTARASRTMDITNEQLKFLGLDFTTCSPLMLEVELPIENEYRDGIWFIERNEKGHSVRKWLDTLPVYPQKIILVDDTYRHVKNMEESLSDLGIEFVGIHYTKAHKHPYRGDIAQKQADYFPKILSDEEADQLLRNL